MLIPALLLHLPLLTEKNLNFTNLLNVFGNGLAPSTNRFSIYYSAVELPKRILYVHIMYIELSL